MGRLVRANQSNLKIEVDRGIGGHDRRCCGHRMNMHAISLYVRYVYAGREKILRACHTYLGIEQLFL